MEVTRTRKAEVCVLFLLEDVEEGVKKAIVFLCLNDEISTLGGGAVGSEVRCG